MPIFLCPKHKPMDLLYFFLLDVDVYYAWRCWWWMANTGHIDDEDQRQPGLRSKQVEGEYKGWGPGGTCLAHQWWKTLVRPKDLYHLLFFVEAQVCKYSLFCYKVSWTSFKKDALHKMLQKITCGISSLAIIWGPRFPWILRKILPVLWSSTARTPHVSWVRLERLGLGRSTCNTKTPGLAHSGSRGRRRWGVGDIYRKKSRARLSFFIRGQSHRTESIHKVAPPNPKCFSAEKKINF